MPRLRLVRLLHSIGPGPSIQRRLVHSAVNSQDANDIRNIAFMAHIDSGKTTLTESVLLSSSYISSPGSVDTGSTTTDFLPAERERGITIQSASIPVKWKNWSFNLIDTPGHVDFGMEVESASRVIDGAVVLMDAVEGVEGQTKGVWRQLDRYNVPTRMIFINKLDRPGASLHNSIHSLLNHRLHHNPVLLTLPISSFDVSSYEKAEPGIQGIVDLVNWEVWRWHFNQSFSHAPAEKVVRTPLPTTEEELAATDIFSPGHPMLKELLPARAALIDNLSVLSPDLISTFFDLPPEPSPYLSMPSTHLTHTLRELTLKGEILPIVCGAALRHVGTEIMMSYIGELLASPVDIASGRTSLIEVSKAPTRALQKQEELQMLAWKVSWDKKRGWMTFVRVYSGTLHHQTTLINTTTQQRERVSKLLLLYASQPEEVDFLSFGSVGVVLGLRHTRTGDTLTSTKWNEHNAPSTLRSITPPPSVISASVIPHTQSDVQSVQEALSSLARTDPSLRVTEDAQEGQTLVHGLGALHLEIVEGRLKEEWGAKLNFGKRRVSYRESFGNESEEGVEFSWRWEKEVGAKKLGATVDLVVRKLEEHEDAGIGAVESWGGNAVSVVVNGKKQQFPSPDSASFDHLKYPTGSAIPSLLQGISSTLLTSPHTLLPLSHLHITISSYKLDPGTPPTMLNAASSEALRKVCKAAGEGKLMEPYVRVKVDVANQGVGKVVKDLTEHGGEILDLDDGSATDDSDVGPYSSEGLYIPPKWITPSSASLTGNDTTTASIKRSINAVAPLSRMLDYSSRLRAVSGGQAVFEMANEGFRSVNDARRMEILKEIGRA
ncbi:Ribosome-releasing factor 2, mitochondrial [Tulasnella sp. 419]|nr:Ribosome-releasing factor 2, mitochondrial [Tulasnella sp. 419]